MDILYLNLDRRPDRNARFLALNEGIARFQRVAAVDGGRLRIVDQVWEEYSGTPDEIDEFKYGYDPAGNRR